MEHNVAGSTGAAPGRSIVDQLASMVAGNVGHLLDHKGDRPIVGGISPGWMKTTSVSDAPNGGTTERWDPKGILVGRLSEDQRYVLTGKSAVMSAAKLAHLDGLAATQVYDAISKLCSPGSPPGERCSSALGIVGRPKGYVLPIAFFNLDDGDADDADEVDSDAPPLPTKVTRRNAAPVVALDDDDF
jgi:hypothetical protein